MDSSREAGQKAEILAERHLAQNGLRLLHRNYRCRAGEIDLICRDGENLVFVEVRLRTHRGFGDALASVDGHKQQKLVRAAQHYLLKTGWQGPCRFDVVGLDAHRHITWVRNAFEA